jgi:hypothetical protein
MKEGFHDVNGNCATKSASVVEQPVDGARALLALAGATWLYIGWCVFHGIVRPIVESGEWPHPGAGVALFAVSLGPYMLTVGAIDIIREERANRT